ncbi:hypothetical protein [Herbiconiux sp. UC225_62]|uniref:hypothetical protein n=1 Tax=Herbiconiux sp. UC225_62 TaxID=3350168 RepID=UPI0036D38CB5
MPTGYTADLYDGKEVSFAEFAMTCSRAFGALVLLRDEPLDAPVPEFKVDDYFTQRLEKAESAIATGYARSMRDWAALEEKARTEANEAREAYFDRQAQILDRYENMLAQVRAWEAPTSEHEGLKKFMIEQLEESIRFDGGGSSWYRVTEPMTAHEYRRKVLDDLHKEREAARESLRDEEKRVAGRNQWVHDLRVSLGIKVGA